MLAVPGWIVVGNIRHVTPPASIVEGFDWSQARMSGRGVITDVQSGPFWFAGLDNRVGFSWMVRGAGQVRVTKADGTVDMISNNPVIENTAERFGLELLAGEDMATTERYVKNPQLVYEVNGVRTYESGYGMHPVNDANGKLIENIEIKPHA